MCLILFSYDAHPIYKLILAANRDEFYDRPTRPLAFWEDRPEILAGRDLKGMGTWLGITPSGRIAAVTNYRDPSSLKENAPSRGYLVSNFLSGQDNPRSYLERVRTVGNTYNGFNLLIGEPSGLYCYSNRTGTVQEISPGLHGLSNHLLDTPWPKIQTGKSKLQRLLDNKNEIHTGEILDMLKDNTLPEDALLPETGMSREWERILSPIFIKSDIYGTMSSSVILIKRNGETSFAERTYIPLPEDSQEPVTREFQLTLSVHSVG